MFKWYSLTPRILETLAWGPTRLAFNIFCHFEVGGQENLKGLKQAIFAVNHANELDPIILTAALSPLGRFVPMFYVGDPDKSFNDKKFGWRRFIYKKMFFRAWGSYPIRPGLKNYELSLKSHEEILADGYSLCMFPEGGITKDGALREGHGGICFLSDKASVPIIPVAIVGSFGMKPDIFFSRNRKMSVRFGAPIFKNELFAGTKPALPEHYKSAAQVVMERIAEMFKN